MPMLDRCTKEIKFFAHGFLLASYRREAKAHKGTVVAYAQFSSVSLFQEIWTFKRKKNAQKSEKRFLRELNEREF